MSESQRGEKNICHTTRFWIQTMERNENVSIGLRNDLPLNNDNRMNPFRCRKLISVLIEALPDAETCNCVIKWNFNYVFSIHFITLIKKWEKSSYVNFRLMVIDRSKPILIKVTFFPSADVTVYGIRLALSCLLFCCAFFSYFHWKIKFHCSHLVRHF